MNNILSWINSNGWLMSIISLMIGAILTSFLSKRKEILLKIADKKSMYYSEYINALLEFGKPAHIRMREDVNGEINRNYFYYKNMIILFGSDDVIEKLAICERNGIDTKSEVGRSLYTDLIKAMKKDIENPKILKSSWKSKKAISNREQHIHTILFDYKKDE